ncbi:MAG: UDP-N-acetylmuramate--L-alanine ligase [Lentisphaerae bacterium ADurb.BinA184]|nr:MAG: UDP-N-acetylmuramate--L-alanine ligase [Lentisphaerae bacterium ADurb.BinA184]
MRRASRCAVIGADSPEALALAGQAAHAVTYSLTDRKADWRAGSVHPHGDGVCFRCRNRTVRLAVPGRHNVANALCAAACCEALGVAPAEALAALESFRGIERRLQVVGRTPDGITILDDFAHNPEKIAASLATLREQPGQIIVFYQPHGFRPTAMLRAGIVEAFASRLAGGDLVLMPEIYYAGGTAERNLSSRDLVADLAARGVDARFAESRAAAADAIERAVRPPRCRVVVMGARDPSLGPFARYLYDTLGQCD